MINNLHQSLVVLLFACQWTASASVSHAAEPDAAAVRTAIEKSLKLIGATADHYLEEKQCFSCHHQALPAMVWQEALRRGIAVDAAAARRQSEFTHEYFAKRREKVAEGRDVPGGPYSAGYALISFQADRWPADDTTGALVGFLLNRQAAEGLWKIQTHRPPLEDSDFTATALAIRGLKHYGDEARKDTIDAAIAKATKWLAGTEPKTHEDAVFRLWGLDWAGADRKVIAAAADKLLADQQPDGGWRQLPDRTTDAYATGQALAALHVAGGVCAEDEAYQRGVQFLLQSQKDDGSWLVETRSKPIQTYFESGYPHGKSQFISLCGGCWATMALLLTLEQVDETAAKTAASPAQPTERTQP